MGTPTFDLRDDHLRVTLDKMASVITLCGDIVVPYSNVASVDVVAPEWPPVLPAWRVGTHFPGLVAKGRFGRTFRGARRFLWFSRDTRRVLRLRLQGHAVYEEISIDAPEAESLRDAIAARLVKR